MGLWPTRANENQRRHPRESGGPCPEQLDSRLRGNDVTFYGGKRSISAAVISMTTQIAGGADVGFLGMSRSPSLKRGAYITTKGVVTYAPPAEPSTCSTRGLRLSVRHGIIAVEFPRGGCSRVTSSDLRRAHFPRQRRPVG
jgi:hypothetical protein